MNIEERLRQSAQQLSQTRNEAPAFTIVRRRAMRRRAVFGATSAVLMLLTGFGALSAGADSKRVRIVADDVADGSVTTAAEPSSSLTTSRTTLPGVSTSATTITTTSSTTAPPPTAAETTAPVATDPPATDPPVTEPPATDPPVTMPPATEPPVTSPPTTPEPAFTPCYVYEDGCAAAAFEPDPDANQPIVFSGGVSTRKEVVPGGAPTTAAPFYYITFDFTLSDLDAQVSPTHSCGAPITITDTASGFSSYYDLNGNGIVGPVPCAATACPLLEAVTPPPAKQPSSIPTSFEKHATPGSYTVTIRAETSDRCSPYYSLLPDRVFNITVGA